MKQENDPVLAAIDAAGANIASNKWIEGAGDGGYDEYVGSLCAAESIEAIRTAYLDFKVAHDSWIERANRALESRKPSDGGEFKREARRIWEGKISNAEAHIVNHLTAAHNADRSADKQRIADLEISIDHLRHGGKVQREQINRMEGVLNAISTACDEAGREKESPKTIAGFIEDQAVRIAELEEQNLDMMALFRDFYDLEFNRDECWEIIKKYGGDA